LLVTISGLPGAGTSTVARRVADDLGLAHVDGGTIFRQLAADSGHTLAEFGERADIDLALDRRLAERAHEGDLVLESRLAGWIAHNEGIDSTRVWITCAEEVRARRVAIRDRLEPADAVVANRAREESERRRYQQYYGIDLDDQSIYDLVLDSSTADPDELVGAIIDRLTRRP
jgi:CMP/dCMP kinase